MRILQFCSKPPLPSVDGGCVASFELTNNLISLGHEVSLLCLSTEKHPFKITNENRDYYLKSHAACISISTKKSWLFYLINSISTHSIQKSRFQNEKAHRFLTSYLNKNSFDLVVFDGLMSAFYFNSVKENTSSKTIYRSHNIEHNLFKERAKFAKNPIKKFVLNSESTKLKKLELDIWSKADQTWTISRIDNDFIHEKLKSNKEKYIPFSLAANKLSETTNPNTFFHLGAMDWAPNLQGILHFINTGWKKFSANNNFELHLGGKGISAVKHLLKGKGIVIHENVANADDFFSIYEVMIVPILTGSGIRIKTVQGLSMGKVVISTEIGAKGIPVENGKHLLFYKTEEDLLKALKEVSQNNALKEVLKKEGKSLYESEFSPDVAMGKITKALNEL